MGNCALYIIMDPAQLGGCDHLNLQVAGLEDYVRGVPLKEGVDSIMLPGDPERRAMKQRLEDGIPLDQGNWSALLDLAHSLDVEPPSVG
jgi:LDH2 family malate/lactate/ureidoglycolate dehydrogenase